MNKVYILIQITTNYMEDINSSAYKTEAIIGIYSSNELAVAKLEDLHEKFRLAQLEYPEFDYISDECEIKEYEVITQ